MNEVKNKYASIRNIVICIIFTVLTADFLHAQQADSSSTDTLKFFRKHNPKIASLLSATVPGLGQAYNRKYIKIPVIYAALGTTAIIVRQNYIYYKDFKTAYHNRTDNNPSTTDNYANYSVSNLQQLKDYHRRNLEISVIIATGIYILNIIDASVDAHLFDFDVTDNLSLIMQPSLTPSYVNGSFNTVFTLSFNIR